MGNEQSVPAPRRPPNKLSKPRTNNNSSANLLSTRASAPASRRNSIATSASPTTNRYSAVPPEALPVEAVEKPKEETQKKRLSLFRSKSAQPKTTKFDANSDVEKGSVEPSPIEQSHRWSRQGRVRGDSVTIESSGDEAFDTPLEMRPPPPRKRMSLQQPYAHHQARLSLVVELPSPQPEKVEIPKRIPRYDQEDASQHTSSMGARTSSDTQLYAPIRRRSLLQHGVATRTSYVEKDSRQSLPSQTKAAEDFQNYYYNPAKPTSSPLSDLAALQHSPEIVPGPRTETPTELDYRHIGAFKLGTLRITNGAASPAPSLERAATMGHEEDYLIAGEARRSAESGHRSGFAQRSNTFSVPVDKNKPWVVRSESPLRQKVETEYPFTERTETPLRQSHEVEAETSESEASPPRQPYVHVPLTIDIPDPSFALFDFNETELLFKSTESPIKSLELAHEYQQDLALSPFSFDNSPLQSPQLQVMSKSMAVEDDLFAPEPLTPVLSDRFATSIDSGYEGGLPARSVKGPREPTPKPLAKADSGYSSNVSLRSFRKDSAPAMQEPPLTPPKDVSRVASSTYSVNSVTLDLALRTKRSLPALPIEEELPPPPLRKAPPVPLKQPPSYVANDEPPAPPVPRKHHDSEHQLHREFEYPSIHSPHLVVPKQTRRQSSPSIPRITRGESPASDSVSSTSSRWQNPKKLSKRPQSVQPEPVFTVQAFRSPSEQLRIPPPSIEARRKLEERVDAFPVACFPNTLAGTVGLRHSSSKETLGTIFSVGSAEVRDELSVARLQSALPPVPTHASIPEHPTTNSFRKGEFSAREIYQIPQQNPPRAPVYAPKEQANMFSKSDFNRRYTYQAPLPEPPADEQWTRKSMQPLIRERDPAPRSWTRPDQDFESHITSFNTISTSLGKSPYDAALPKSRPSTKSQVQERAKSMTAQFEADAAARFAYRRSMNQESSGNVVQARKSYDSIANGNPFVEAETSEQSRGRPYPPQTHAKFNTGGRRTYSLLQSQFSTAVQTPPVAQGNNHIGTQFHGYGQDRQDEDEETRRFSTLSSRSLKTKSPPPVSMTTQRKLTPTSLGSHKVIPPSRTPPIPSQAPNRIAPQPPTAPFTPNEEIRVESEQWTQTANVWASRRQSAGEVLKIQTRKSMEMRRPQAQTERPDLRTRKSMDAPTYRERLHPTTGPGPRQALHSNYRSFDTSQGYSGYSGLKMGWNVGVGYENSTHNPAHEAHRTWVDTPQDQQQEYNHTYGSSSHHNKENFHHQEEYYEPSSHTQDYHQQREVEHLPHFLHSRTSTSSLTQMPILDRFSGGLAYGYEPGYGLNGSAGTRNSGNVLDGAKAVRKGEVVSTLYGVDFSDVPVFLQRQRRGESEVGA